jgi:hypothetical protein
MQETGAMLFEAFLDGASSADEKPCRPSTKAG